MFALLGQLFFAVSVVPIVLGIAYVLMTLRFSWGTKIMYLLVWFLETPGALIRGFFAVISVPLACAPFWMVTTIVLGIIYWITGLFSEKPSEVTKLIYTASLIGINSAITVVVGTVWVLMWSVGPLLLSFFQMLGWPGPTWLTAILIGADNPSERERNKYHSAAGFIKTRGSAVHWKYPKNIKMLARTDDILFTIGGTMFISETAIKQDNFDMLLAMELYYYNKGESRITLALRSFVVLPFYILSRIGGSYAPGNIMTSFAKATDQADVYILGITSAVINALLALAGGGFGLFLTTPYWMARERGVIHKADWYGGELGYRQEIIAYLDGKSAIPELRPIPYFLSPEVRAEIRHDRIVNPQGTPQVPQPQATNP